MKAKVKRTNDELLQTIQIKSIEKESLDRVFDQLTILEQEESSDDDSLEKQYLKNISEKANQKKMKLKLNESMISKEHNKSKENPPNNKKYEEDPQEEDLHRLYRKKFGKKALRKMLRRLINADMKEEIKLMIWENDENLDGFIDYSEYEKLYKRCIIDEKEEEPKKLYYLIQFLMYDKEKKGYIIEEDTLEILYIRWKQKFEDAIVDIFAELDSSNQINRKNPTLKKQLNYSEYVERMHLLSQNKRDQIAHKRKDYCDYIPDILKSQGLPIIHSPIKKFGGKK